jgi:hypothetical protein
MRLKTLQVQCLQWNNAEYIQPHTWILCQDYAEIVLVDETTNRLTVHFRILSCINPLILRRTNDHAKTSHATDITQPFQTLSDIIWSFPIEIAYKPTHFPILSHWIIL